MSKKPSILEIIKKHFLADFIDVGSAQCDLVNQAEQKYSKQIEAIKSELTNHFDKKEVYGSFAELDTCFCAVTLETLYHAFNSGFDAGVSTANECRTIGQTV